MPLKKSLTIIQGLYFALTGLWPIVHIKSFMAVAGPKTDLWLVKTVGLLLAVNGVVFLLALTEKHLARTTKLLAGGVPVVTALVDFYYVLNDVISPVYLVDGFIQVIFIAGWVMVWWQEKSEAQT
jgi:hypothetical protein